MAIYSNLNIDQGSTFDIKVDITDADDAILNLTNYNVAGQIRKNFSSSTAVAFTATVYNASAGTIKLLLDASTTNAMKAGRYVYDVEMSFVDSDSNTIIERILEGRIVVTPSVTR